MTVSRLYSNTWEENKLERIWKEAVVLLLSLVYPEILRNTTNISVRVTGALIEIRAEHLSIKSIGHYLCTNLLGIMLIQDVPGA
jgi:hypothetical protein